MKIVTSNIERECWNILELYEDSEYIVDKIKKANPITKNITLTKTASEIAFYIKQAEELYNASDSSIITNPLTLFYALNNLVKAAYLINNPTKGLSASHGLEIVKNSTKNISLKDICVEMTASGTFLNLNEMLNNNLPMKCTIRIDDILSIIPELTSIYYLTYGRESNVYLLLKNRDRRGEYKILLPNKTCSELKNKDTSMIKSTNAILTYGTNAFGDVAIIQKTMATTNFENVIEYDLNNNRYITLGCKVNDNYIKVEQLNAIYILFYVYSMQVRYSASAWMKIISSKEKAIIQKSINELKIKMLIYIISLLDKNNTEFVEKIDDYNEKINYSDITDKILSELKRRRITSNRSPLDGIN